MKRVNLTQHDATSEQKCEGRTLERTAEIKALLTFEEIPTLDEVTRRARKLADLAAQDGADEAMIGGAPYLMIWLDLALRMRNITPAYAFSWRGTIETKMDDGSVVKETVFRRLGFVWHVSEGLYRGERCAADMAALEI